MTLTDSTEIEPSTGDRNDTTERRVGVEVEFGGLSARRSASVVVDALGGELVELDPHRFDVTTQSLGKVRIELDSKYVHGDVSATQLERSAREWVGDFGDAIIPTELVTEPLPVWALGKVDTLVEALANAGATGNEKPHLACGLHLNIEWKKQEVEPILRVLQAYILLSSELRSQIDPDRTRKLLPFIAQYPHTYETKVLDPDYQPDFTQFTRDYCEANPNKNRELDLLPLLATVDQDLVASTLGEVYPAARPAFHYRLPDAQIGNPKWSICREWQRWLTVEDLATDQSRLMERMADYRTGEAQAGFFDATIKAIKRVTNE